MATAQTVIEALRLVALATPDDDEINVEVVRELLRQAPEGHAAEGAGLLGDMLREGTLTAQVAVT